MSKTNRMFIAKNSLTKNILPLNIVVRKAKGTKFWDYNGKEYLDFSSQTLNLNLGNSPNIVKKAFLKQFKKFTFLSTRFTSRVLIELADELIRISPKGFSKVNLKLTNGSDANESAFKRVRTYRKKPYIVSFYWSHLGESCETLSASGKDFNLKKLSGSKNFIYIPNPFMLKNQGYSLESSENQVLEQLRSLFRQRNDIAAIIIEPIMVNAGGFSFSKRFLKELRNMCSKNNISLIFDEIQTAFGWLGTFFASNFFGVTPDIITLGKGLSGGFPLAAIIMKEEYDLIDYGEDEYTYGGHPISCAIALEVITFLKHSDIFSQVTKKGNLLKKLLSEIAKTNKEYIKEIRGYGLILSLEFYQDKHKDLADRVYRTALDKGLVLRKSFDGHGPSLVLKPPITVSVNEINKATKLLSESIYEVIKTLK